MPFESIGNQTEQAAMESRPLRFIVFAGLVFLHFRIIYRIFLYPRFFSPLRNIPGPPNGNPLFGQFLPFIKGMEGIIQREWLKKYGPVVRVAGLGMEVLIFTKPDAMQKILVSDHTNYPRPERFRDAVGIITGYGLFTATGKEHKQMRKAMNPAFSIPNLMAQSDMYYGPIEGLVDILRSQINSEEEPSNGKEVFIYSWLGKLTLDIICKTAFGYQLDALHNPHNELAWAQRTLSHSQSGMCPNGVAFAAILSIPGAKRLMASEWAYRHRTWLPKWKLTRQLGFVLESLHLNRKASTEILRNNLNGYATTSPDSETRGNIMSILATIKKADLDGGDGGYTLSDDALIDQVFTFMGAGHESVTAGLGWTLWLLANDPESQAKLRAEVAPIFAANPRPNYSVLKELQWLDCVLQEGLRLMPPAPASLRQATKTDFIDGVLVPKGTLLYIPIRAINTSKEVWGDDAEEFNPARWLNLPPSYKPSFSSLTFLAGPHGCIGKTQAIAEMKAILGAFIANFEIRPAYTGQVPRTIALVTMIPEDDLPVRISIAPSFS